MTDKIPASFDIASYRYDLPPEKIAQHPVAERDCSKLLSYNRRTGGIRDCIFSDIIEFFSPGDLLVVNNTKVFPARLLGKKESGGRVELLVLHYPGEVGLPGQQCGAWEGKAEVIGLLRSSKRCRPGQLLVFDKDLTAEVIEVMEDGKARVRLCHEGDLGAILDRVGRLPLPPYIKREQGEEGQDRERYQTVFAAHTGAIAAPTAGLHFTAPLLKAIDEKGVERQSITLHVGYGTFAPVRVQDIRNHEIHSEYVTIGEKTAAKINEVIKRGNRLWVVGTTTVRALESAADESGRIRAGEGWCNLYIYPGYRFKVVKNLITNFHLPGSSLLFMVSALMGRDELFSCYRHALAHDYRFFSYGDAMIIQGEDGG